VTIRFLEIAEIELDDAIRWSGTQAPGLDNAFLIEVLSAADDRIVRFPEAWPALDAGVRRYAIEHGDILVLAVAHLHRQPDYWRDRLKRRPARSPAARQCSRHNRPTSQYRFLFKPHSRHKPFASAPYRPKMRVRASRTVSRSKIESLRIETCVPPNPSRYNFPVTINAPGCHQ
jgi:toxin ParE2